MPEQRPQLILYVAADKRMPSRYHVGSALCLNLLPKLGGTVSAETVSVEDRSSLPWLEGTPSIRDEGGKVHKGSECLLFLQERAISLAEQRGDPPPKADNRRRERNASARRADITVPTMQLRPEEKKKGMEEDMDAPGGGEEDETEQEDLWQSSIPEGETEEKEGVDGNSKLTSDDFNKFMQTRGGA